jgi:hypothetical protein
MAANAQDWVMDWHSTGVTLFDTWNLSGTSTATLTPTTLGPGFHPDGPGYVLSYTYQGRQYGGFVAQGRFQDSGFSVPAAGGPPISSNSFGPGTNANGEFNFTGSTFTADVFVGTGHSNAHWTASGRLASVAAAEPVVLLLSGAGLVCAGLLRQSRRS